MRRTRDGRSFADIYREQYRQTSSTWAARLLRAVSPFVLLFAVLSHGRGATVMIVVGGVGIAMIVAAGILGRSRAHAEPSADRAPAD
jgi:hypothetical protein